MEMVDRNRCRCKAFIFSGQILCFICDPGAVGDGNGRDAPRCMGSFPLQFPRIRRLILLSIPQGPWVQFVQGQPECWVHFVLEYDAKCQRSGNPHTRSVDPASLDRPIRRRRASSKSVPLCLIHTLVAFRNMPCQISRVMENARDLYNIAATAVDQKVPRLFHARAAHSVPTERKMVRSRAFDHDLRTFLRSGTLGIAANVTQGLRHERGIAQRRGFAEFFPAPFQNADRVAMSGACNANFKRGAGQARLRSAATSVEASSPACRMNSWMSSPERNVR